MGDISGQPKYNIAFIQKVFQSDARGQWGRVKPTRKTTSREDYFTLKRLGAESLGRLGDNSKKPSQERNSSLGRTRGGTTLMNRSKRAKASGKPSEKEWKATLKLSGGGFLFGGKGHSARIGSRKEKSPTTRRHHTNGTFGGLKRDAK